MPFDPQYLVYGAIFLFVLLGVEGFFYLVVDARRGGNRNINRRLRMLSAGTDSREVLYKLRRKRSSEESAINEFLRLLRPLARFDDLITQSGLMVSTSRMLGIMAALWGVSFVILGVLLNLPAIRSVLISLGPAVLPVFYLMTLKRRRLKRFTEQFPDTLDLIVRSLRAGHPISTAMGLVAQEMPDPIGTEFGIAVDEMTYGLDLRDALQNMSMRVQAQDLQYLVVAINIQHGTGGNLAEVLDGLSKVIRDRFHMFSKIKALSAEGRLSAVILSILPLVVAGTVWGLNPRYFNDVKDDPMFMILMSVGLGLLIAGNFIMWRMVRIRV